ncbi:MAG: tyrosine-type recombinase/integrase [Brevundimonas sp.]
MRALHRLSALRVRQIDAPGRYPDGGGLYLQIGKGGARSWIFRYSFNGRERDMGLGSAALVTLAEAREAAFELRRQRQKGIDPLEARKAAEVEARRRRAEAVTFAQAVKDYLKLNRAGWRNDKHAAQWAATLRTYAEPHVGERPVASIDVNDVLTILEPIWVEKPETASRLRGRIEAVLDWSAVRGQRTGANPARWRGNLEKLLPAKSKVQKIAHHAALPHKELPKFMARLRGQGGTAARALEFTILTAARTGETIGASPAEIDFDDRLWTVPPERMKAGREHRAPLSAAALALVESRRESDQPWLFAGMKAGSPLSNMSMLAVLKRMGRADLTTHGFRSTFRDWAAETTDYPAEVVEMALAHTIVSKVEAAYRRGDLLAKRRQLMEDWAGFCGSAPTSAPAA